MIDPHSISYTDRCAFPCGSVRSMGLPDIDWNALWREKQAEKWKPVRDSGFWDKRAPEFTRHVRTDDYINQFLAIMKPRPEWRVLDIGSAAGTLAVPMAPFVRSITAVDPSVMMRKLLEERCREEGIDNIRIVDGKWEDDWSELGIGVHDVVIASRSLLVDDLRGAVMKMQRHASKRIYVSTVVGDGPHDPKIYAAVDRPYRSGVDYIVLVNLLHQMGIYADLSFTCNRDVKTYADVEDALNSMRWMIHEMTDAEELKLRKHLARTLIRVDGRLQMPYRRVVRWAVLWWEKSWAGMS